MDHLVNMRKVERINRLNLQYGMPPIRMQTP